MAITTSVDRISQPTAPIAGYQSWRQLLFLHWQVDPARLQAVLPPGLSIECFAESAWLGLVPFSMERVRPWWFSSVPGVSNFLETNVRTYVRHESGQTGVWFFSLDAASRIAVWAARKFWRLPYHHARMSIMTKAVGDQAETRCSGVRTADGGVAYHIETTMDSAKPLQEASPGTLDDFLLERYVLFAPTRSGGLCCGRVHHEPYQFRSMAVQRCEQTLTRPMDCGLELQEFPVHAVYSPGVDVTVTALQPL